MAFKQTLQCRDLSLLKAFLSGKSWKIPALKSNWYQNWPKKYTCVLRRSYAKHVLLGWFRTSKHLTTAPRKEQNTSQGQVNQTLVFFSTFSRDSPPQTPEAPNWNCGWPPGHGPVTQNAFFCLEMLIPSQHLVSDPRLKTRPTKGCSLEGLGGTIKSYTKKSPASGWYTYRYAIHRFY